MGKASRDKGLRRERAIVDLHNKCGLRAERVPLSGATHYRGNGADVDLYVRGTRIDVDTDTARSKRRRDIELGPVPANDAIARDVA